MCQPFTGHREAQSLLELSQYLDANAFDALFYVDHFFLEGDRYLAEPRAVEKPYQLECFTTLAAVAAVTRRLRVGPLVTPLPLRHPSFVAKMAATIDIFSGGRLILAVGAGWNRREYSAFSFPFEEKLSTRFEMLTEGVEIIRALWTTQGPVNYVGKHYRLEEAPFYPKPVQKPYPPIWFGGAGPKALDAVARLGNGWSPAAPHYNAVTPEVYRRSLAIIRDPGQILPAFLLNTSISESKEQAWQLARAQQLREDWKDIPLDDMRASGVLAVGDPEDCIAHLQRYVDAGVRYFIVCPIPMTMASAREMARLYVESVIPYIKVQT
jgi:probable F420-dependent oxidoreductase